MYLVMLENYLMLHFQQDLARGFIFQQDDVSPHFHCKVTAHLSHAVPVGLDEADQ
jgi:hypothetical protein